MPTPPRVHMLLALCALGVLVPSAGAVYAFAKDVSCSGGFLQADSPPDTFVGVCEAYCDGNPSCVGFTQSNAGVCKWFSSPFTRTPTQGVDCYADATLIGDAKAKCAVAEETPTIYRSAQTASSETFELSGSDTGCVHRTYEEPEALQCLANRWLITIGGSNHLQYAQGVIQYFHPCPEGYNCNRNAYYSCIPGETCDFSSGWAFQWMDIVLKPDGTVHTFKASKRAIASSDGSTLTASAATAFTNYIGTVPAPPAGYFRHTHFVGQWFNKVPLLLDLCRNAWPAGPPPMLHLSIGRWYGGKQNRITPEMTAMFDHIRTNHPDVTECYVEDDPYTVSYIDAVFANEPAVTPARMLKWRTLYADSNVPQSELIYNGHRTPMLHHLLWHRFLNVVCPADDAEAIYFSAVTSPKQGCIADGGSGGWSQIMWQGPCTFQRELFLPQPPPPPTKAPTSAPTLAPTKSPTDSPTLAPTQFPTQTPTTGTPTVTNNPTNIPTPPTFAPTLTPSFAPTLAPTRTPTTSPTNFPTKAPTRAPTPRPGIVIVQPIPISNISGGVAWRTFNVSLVQFGEEDVPEEVLDNESNIASRGDLKENWFHILAAILSTLFVVLVWAYWGAPPVWIWAARDRLCCCCACCYPPEDPDKVYNEEGDVAMTDNPVHDIWSGLEKMSNARSTVARFDAAPKHVANGRARMISSIEGYDFLAEDDQAEVSTFQLRRETMMAPPAKPAPPTRRPPPTPGQGASKPAKPAKPGKRGKPLKPAKRNLEMMQSAISEEDEEGSSLQTNPVLGLTIAEETTPDDLPPVPSGEGDAPRKVLRAAATEAPMAGTGLTEVTTGAPVVPVEEKKRPRMKLDAFGAARFIASVHVVAGHLVRKKPQPIENWYTSDWGYTWVPWFMMLSGFILTYARLASRRPDVTGPIHTFVLARFRSVYPLYLAGLFSAAALSSFVSGKPFTLGDPGATIASLLMVQAWIPTVTEQVFQTHCWFLSCIVPYWVLHIPMYRVIKKAPVSVLWAILITVSVLPWIALAIIPAAMGDLYWYQGHQWRAIDTWQDIMVVMLKFHPIFYLPTYIFGMALACLFIKVREKPPLVVRYGAVIGYLGLALVFILSPWLKLPASKLTCRLGALAPLQGLTLIGLAVGTDPVARAFSFFPFQVSELVSYPQYIFQFIVFTIWGRHSGYGYWALLLAMCIIGYVTVQEPLRKPDKRIRPKILALFGLVGIPLLCCGLYALSGQTPPGPKIPPPGPLLPTYVYYSADAYDARVNLTHSADQLLGGRFDEYSSINPALHHQSRNATITHTASGQVLEQVSDLWVAVRRHRLELVKNDTALGATVDGEPLFTNLGCKWDPVAMVCPAAMPIPDGTATNKEECQGICCDTSECMVWHWFEFFADGNITVGRCFLGGKAALTNGTCVDDNGERSSDFTQGAIKNGEDVLGSGDAGFDSNWLQTVRPYEWQQQEALGTVSHVWHSDISIGLLHPGTLEPLCPMLALPSIPVNFTAQQFHRMQPNASNVSFDYQDSAWTPCRAFPAWSAKNNTMNQAIATGAEDPRLFMHNGHLHVMFHSRLPVPRDPGVVDPEVAALKVDLCPADAGGQLFIAVIPDVQLEAWRSSCGRTISTTIIDNTTASSTSPPPSNNSEVGDDVQSLVTSKTSYNVSEPGEVLSEASPLRVEWLKWDDSGETQKNWMPFEIEGQLLFLQSIDPWIIAEFDEEANVVNQQYRTTETRVQLTKDVVFHGGSPGLLIPPEELPPIVAPDIEGHKAAMTVILAECDSLVQRCLALVVECDGFATAANKTDETCVLMDVECTILNDQCAKLEQTSDQIDSTGGNRALYNDIISDCELVDEACRFLKIPCDLNLNTTLSCGSAQDHCDMVADGCMQSELMAPGLARWQQMNAFLVRESYILAAFHTISLTTGAYQNFFMEIKTVPPYKLLRVSRPLPLLEAPVTSGSGVSRPMAFASGLTRLPGGRIALSYGSTNEESRVLVLSRKGLEELFEESVPV